MMHAPVFAVLQDYYSTDAIDEKTLVVIKASHIINLVILK